MYAQTTQVRVPEPYETWLETAADLGLPLSLATSSACVTLRLARLPVTGGGKKGQPTEGDPSPW
jgi:hypothetical protein